MTHPCPTSGHCSLFLWDTLAIPSVCPLARKQGRLSVSRLHRKGSTVKWESIEAWKRESGTLDENVSTFTDSAKRKHTHTHAHTSILRTSNTVNSRNYRKQGQGSTLWGFLSQTFHSFGEKKISVSETLE